MQAPKASEEHSPAITPNLLVVRRELRHGKENGNSIAFRVWGTESRNGKEMEALVLSWNIGANVDP